jgi:hypothetical protein
MTEDEAKTKWCPEVRTGNGDTPGSFNRFIGEPHGEWNSCLGSKCMAWFSYHPGWSQQQGLPEGSGECLKMRDRQ